MRCGTFVCLAGDALAAASAGVCAELLRAPQLCGDELVEVMVTATRRAEPLQGVPLSVKAIGGAELAAENVTAQHRMP